MDTPIVLCGRQYARKPSRARRAVPAATRYRTIVRALEVARTNCESIDKALYLDLTMMQAKVEQLHDQVKEGEGALATDLPWERCGAAAASSRPTPLAGSPSSTAAASPFAKK